MMESKNARGSIKDGIGASVRRKEDKRFLMTGPLYGRYLASGTVACAFHPVGHAHAKIVSIDTAGGGVDGVVAIYTGDDVAADDRRADLRLGRDQPRRRRRLPHPILAIDTVKYVATTPRGDRGVAAAGA